MVALFGAILEHAPTEVVSRMHLEALRQERLNAEMHAGWEAEDARRTGVH